MLENLKQVQLDLETMIQLPGHFLPSFRTALAIQEKANHNILIATWGGIGDQICAEPTLRYALKNFKGNRFTLYSPFPELFKHLPFDEVIEPEKGKDPDFMKYLCFNTAVPSENITAEFFSHMLTNCVDFPSICAFRMQLPIKDREVKIPVAGSEMPEHVLKWLGLEKVICVHPGKHWPVKTFPKDWWDTVLKRIIACGVTPTLIGGKHENRATVNVETAGCLDLREKLTLRQSIFLLQHADVLLTNDSSPMHMAASGNAWIGFIATCKHPDYITHWRQGQFGWKMQNHGVGGVWEGQDYCPNDDKLLNGEEQDHEVIRSWLPDPIHYADWALEKAHGY